MKTSVTWQEFMVAFAKLLKMPIPTDPRDARFKCLRRVVADKDAEKVTIESFANMLEWFGPLNDPGILNRVKLFYIFIIFLKFLKLILFLFLYLYLFIFAFCDLVVIDDINAYTCLFSWLILIRPN